jgi:LDH2 family malate/lactate/ureidoglycolate dehydrogenase
VVKNCSEDRTCKNVYYIFLEMYVRDVKEGTTLPDGQPIIDKETVSTALVNANNILGPVSGGYKS